jgi:outer membrane protein assembly factor BamB
MTRRLCLSFLSLALTLTLSAADWPRFRGPNGAGVADGPVPNPDAAHLLWKTPIPGRGNSSPIVVGGKVFVQSASEDGSKRVLVCVDAATGKVAWTKDRPGEKAHIHKSNTLASNTPASDGELVYCVWWDGPTVSLVAYDFAGAVKWEQPLGAYKSEHGAGHSPAVYKGKVFVNLDQDGKATLFAFDAKTGSRAWGPVERPAHRACYGVPYLYEPPGKPAELIIGSTPGIDSYDPDTGMVNWHFTITWPDPKKKLRTIGAPVLAAGMIVFYFGEGGDSRYAVAVKPGGTGDVSATAKGWEVRKSVPYVPSMLTKDGLLFWMHDNGFACCADAETGKLLWEERVFGKEVFASPVLIGDRVLVLTAGGNALLFKAAKDYEEVAKLRLPEGVMASPAIANGKLYIRGTGHLFCYGEKK